MPFNRGADAVESTSTSVSGADAPVEYRTLAAVHRRLWSWRWSSGGDSALDRELAQMQDTSCSATGPEEAAAVAWTGNFPAVRGGVVVFTLTPRKAFTIAVGCECDMNGAAPCYAILIACLLMPTPVLTVDITDFHYTIK